jgi:hypothetical protein
MQQTFFHGSVISFHHPVGHLADDVGHFSMLASVELKKRENRDDLDFLQMNGYLPCSIYSI